MKLIALVQIFMFFSFFYFNLSDCFNLKLNPISYLDLNDDNQSSDVFINVFNYPQQIEPYERFKILQTDINKNYLVLGARNRIITINSNSYDQVQIFESYFPVKERSLVDKNCSDRNCANYILATLPIQKNGYNLLVCGTYYGLFQCVQTEQNKQAGTINSYDSIQFVKAPKSITLPLNNQNAYYLSASTQNTTQIEHVLYAASSWTDNGQYLAAHSSQNSYQDESLNKKIGVSKSFVRFVEANNKLFLFQNEYSYDVDDGEKDRDILISTSLVSQICKNDDEVLNKETSFYSELTAKIYCFKDAFRTNSGNSRNFKFDSLEFVTDLIDLKKKSSNHTKKVFYAAFNTPKNQITGAAICFFDINDISSVFQKQNFKYLDNNNENHPKNMPFNPQDCPNLGFLEKIKYRSFTSKLSYMTKAALPVRKRKASFIATNEYRITCLYVVDDLDEFNMQPSVKRLDKYQNLNIIYAGTDNGKIMRIAHYFSDSYFKNDNSDEENVVVLEEIQLFDSNTTINEITILNSQNSKRIYAVSGKQIKSIPIDFCELHSESCEKCLNANNNKYYNSQCYWSKNTCQSELKLNSITNGVFFDKVEHCDLLKTTTTTSTTTTTTQTSTIGSKLVDSNSNFILSADTTSIIKPEIEKSFDELNKSKTNDYLDLNGGREPLSSMLLVDDKNRAAVNGISLDQNQNLKNETNGNPALYVSLSIFASVIGLIIGIITGFVIKANYSKRLTKFLRKPKTESNSKDNSNFEINASDKDGSLEVISSKNQYIFGVNNNNDNKSSNENTNDSLECSSRSSTDESLSSSTKSTNFNENYCHSSTSNSSRTSNVDLNRKYIRSKELFTVQNDYGIFPKSYYEKIDNYMNKKGGINITTSSPPLHEQKLNPNKTNLINNRLSSMSSSTDSSTHNANHIINSQTSLLNASKDSFRSKRPSHHMTINETTTTTSLSPLSRHLSLKEKPITYVSNYSNTNCIVVNDDDEEQEINLNNKISMNKIIAQNETIADINHRYSSLSSASSYGPNAMLDSIVSSSEASNNWPSAASRTERYHKNHHVRKHNSFIYTKLNRNNLINQNSLNNNEIKLKPELIVRESLNKDYEKTKTYINNSYV